MDGHHPPLLSIFPTRTPHAVQPVLCGNEVTPSQNSPVDEFSDHMERELGESDSSSPGDHVLVGVGAPASGLSAWNQSAGPLRLNPAAFTLKAAQPQPLKARPKSSRTNAVITSKRNRNTNEMHSDRDRSTAFPLKTNRATTA